MAVSGDVGSPRSGLYRYESPAAYRYGLVLLLLAVGLPTTSPILGQQLERDQRIAVAEQAEGDSIPGSEAPFMLCVEDFFDEPELLRQGSYQRRSLESSVTLAPQALSDLVSVKAQWDVLRNAQGTEFNARWEPSLRAKTADREVFLAEQSDYLRRVSMPLAENFRGFLDKLTVDQRHELLRFIRQRCADITFFRTKSSWSEGSESLFADFTAEIGAEP